MCVCAYHCAQLLHTIQHGTILIIFFILQTATTAEMLSIKINLTMTVNNSSKKLDDTKYAEES